MANRNNTIAKNTLFLYIRLILVTGVGLYTSRIVLEALGESDFGIFTLAGSLIAFFSVLNTTMSSSIQRFLSYYIGSDDISCYNETINAGIRIHYYIALIILLLAETVGLWIFYNYLNIPLDRKVASHFVYQFSLLATIATIVGIPYTGLVIAWERMDFFAYLALIEVSVKLIIAFVVKYCSNDKLILYSGLYFLATVIPVIITYYYCRINFNMPRFKKVSFKSLICKKMLSFSYWNFLGNFATIFFWQGINIFLNIFYGVVLNAAMAITNQVTGAVSRLITSFQMAYKPAIIKEYAQGDNSEFLNIILKSAKFSFYLLYAACFPLICNVEIITKWWLTTVPEYTNVFIQILLISLMLNAISVPLLNAIEATGDIKSHQITNILTQILAFPMAYVMLKFGVSPIWVVSLNVLISIIMFVVKMIILKDLIKFPLRRTFKDVGLPIIYVISVSNILYVLMNANQSLLSIGINGIIVLMTILAFGLNKSEKKMIYDLIYRRIKK